MREFLVFALYNPMALTVFGAAMFFFGYITA
jgi:hypothetical protein